MTAPTYTRFQASHTFRLRPFRWAWEVTGPAAHRAEVAE